MHSKATSTRDLFYAVASCPSIVQHMSQPSRNPESAHHKLMFRLRLQYFFPLVAKMRGALLDWAAMEFAVFLFSEGTISFRERFVVLEYVVRGWELGGDTKKDQRRSEEI
jgi:hypothetical protein